MPFNDEVPEMKRYLELSLVTITGLLVSCAGAGSYGQQGSGGWGAP